MDIPFKTLELHLKQVRAPDLSEVEKRTLGFFFPGYAGKGFLRTDAQDGLLAGAQQMGFDIVEDNTLPRRYAGDHSLPRTRYHAVCRTESGDDGGTLLNELRAYSRPDESGFFFVIDSTGNDAEAAHARTLLQPGKHGLLCVPKDTFAFPTPYADVIGIDRRRMRSLLVGVIPMTLTTQRIERVIDLRHPEVQTWFTTCLTNLHDPTTRKPCFPIAGPITDFTRLLPALLSQSLGDNRRVTQIAGIWLRNIRANALIFPSARNNTYATFRDGQLVDFAGWNLVDYRDTPPPVIAGALDVSPEWEPYPLFGGSLPLTADSSESPTVVYDKTLIAQVTNGPAKGSLQITGLTEQREPYYQVLIWLHFSRRLATFYPDIHTDHLNELFHALCKTEKGLDMHKLALVSSFACGAVFGAPEPQQSLKQLAQKLQDGGNTGPAELIRHFLARCASLPQQPAEG